MVQTVAHWLLAYFAFSLLLGLGWVILVSICQRLSAVPRPELSAALGPHANEVQQQEFSKQLESLQVSVSPESGTPATTDPVQPGSAVTAEPEIPEKQGVSDREPLP